MLDLSPCPRDIDDAWTYPASLLDLLVYSDHTILALGFRVDHTRTQEGR